MRYKFLILPVVAIFTHPAFCITKSDINNSNFWINPEEVGMDNCLNLNYNTCDSYDSDMPTSSSCAAWCNEWLKTRTKKTRREVNGIATYTWPLLYVECPINGQVHCEFRSDPDTDSISVCASGYYGNGTTCTKCPANATCSGEGNTTFTCKSGYCKSGNSCVAIPDNAYCSFGEIKCKSGYYQTFWSVGDECSACPSPGTSSSGATSKTQCFVSGGTDATGTFQYEPKCYYSN